MPRPSSPDLLVTTLLPGGDSKVSPTVSEAWIHLRSALWPDESEDHRQEVAAFLAGHSPHIDQVWIAEMGGQAVGFLEARIRPEAPGSTRGRIPYVEGWFVTPEQRGRRVGAALMAACEAWARAQGFSELASDTEVHNVLSQRAHAALGFEEVERTVAFWKSLGTTPTEPGGAAKKA